LIDLGAGDGIVQKIASEYGAKSVGIELNPIIATIAKIRLRKIKNAKIVTKNFYNYKFPRETTVVYVFGDSRDLSKIFKKIEKEAKRLSKTLKVISYGFETKDYELLKKVGAYFLYEVR
jgi:predicted RNA methylase